MNTERILALANLIEGLPHTNYDASSGFTMECTMHSCGTPGCIAGWAAWEQLGRPDEMSIVQVYKRARDWLGLDRAYEQHLFEPLGCDENKFTPAHAARVLRKLAETGKVDWEGTR